MSDDLDEITISGNSKLVEDISSLYEEENFSDVAFVISTEKVRAHKAILAARSVPFKSLLIGNSEQPEITIDTATMEIFRMLLKFIYTGNVTIKLSALTTVTKLLVQAHQYQLKDLEFALNKKIEDILDLDKAIEILSVPNIQMLEELTESCYKLLDQNASEVLKSDSLQRLTQTSLVELLDRSTFVVPEIEVFNAVAKWRRTNKDPCSLVTKSIRLQCLTLPEILLTVRPTKLVDNEILLDAIGEVTDVTPRTIPCRSPLVEDNLATPTQNAEVTSGTQTEFLLNGNRDVNKCASHKIGDEWGITIKLGRIAFVNHIQMQLPDQDTRYYSYYIQISDDGKNWHKLIDYSRYHCRSEQNLYFQKSIVRYVRVVGTFSSANDDFELVFFEIGYKKVVPKTVNGVVFPNENVATLEKKAIIIEGGNPDEILNGNYTNFDRTQGWTYHTLDKDSIIIQLPQPYMIGSIRMRLYDEDARIFRYYVETSPNNNDWEMVVDRREGRYRSWQRLRFPERPVVYIKLTGTYNSEPNNEWFYVVHLECPDLAEEE